MARSVSLQIAYEYLSLAIIFWYKDGKYVIVFVKQAVTRQWELSTKISGTSTSIHDA